MALLEAITCGNTEIPSCDLRIALKKLAAINPKTKMSGLASEYQVLYNYCSQLLSALALHGNVLGKTLSTSLRVNCLNINFLVNFF